MKGAWETCKIERLRPGSSFLALARCWPSAAPVPVRRNARRQYLLCSNTAITRPAATDYSQALCAHGDDARRPIIQKVLMKLLILCSKNEFSTLRGLAIGGTQASLTISTSGSKTSNLLQRLLEQLHARRRLHRRLEVCDQGSRFPNHSRSLPPTPTHPRGCSRPWRAAAPVSSTLLLPVPPRQL